jgi:glucosamine-6-phosphate deaminase
MVFSPHPDDDVISMGGILRKLTENGNDITIAYQTSGNIAVFDHEVRRFLDFVERARSLLDLADAGALGRRIDEVEERLAHKEPGSVDSEAVLELKRIIRETEAVSALEAVGLRGGNARFMNLPFYRTGTVRKDPIGQRDVELTLALLDEVRPSIIFAAGDLSDPHGTHRMCLEALTRALEVYRGPSPQLWLYRGAWQEWPLPEADVLVPMSAEELRRKIMAIFKHQSQKDVAPFPGPDPREFWQRVEERNRGTAELLRSVGLPAYYAMEAFVVLEGGERLMPELVSTASLGEGD